MDKAYIEVVRLLLESTPAIFQTPHFAMKGGTAINLFVEDMQRLSVDIDVVFVDHRANREAALKAISSGLAATQERLSRAGLESEVSASKAGDELKLFIRRAGSQVRVEVNQVFRGTVLPVQVRRLGPMARGLFTMDLSVPILDVAELYGSKLVAAMDRQHPRDLFDARGLFKQAGLTPQVVECFVCYLAGHNRPVHEVLFSRDHDMEQAFSNEFSGMTREPISLTELQQVRRRMTKELPVALTSSQRRFLLGLVAGEPDWSLMSCPHLAALPAIRWKLQNLAKLKKTNPRKFTRQAEELREKLEG
jgi:hypothetical protein